MPLVRNYIYWIRLGISATSPRRYECKLASDELWNGASNFDERSCLGEARRGGHQKALEKDCRSPGHTSTCRRKFPICLGELNIFSTKI